MLPIVLLCAFSALAHAQSDLQVNTTQGVVQGAFVSNGSYYTFYGLHYAGSTSGENRFKAPTPAPTYPGLFHAIDSNVLCAQPSAQGTIGVEDCLTLNVFTTSPNTTKPVLVWLIGDEYTNSDISKDTTHIRERNSFHNLVQDVVVVQINYRLSVFGFLCLGVAEAPGNAGLKDIVQGLRWIQNNILAFGGDPNNVILFGHGSAAAMVDLITMSPLANNLVHKAIAQSGSALSPWAVSYNPVQAAQSLGAKLGYSGKRNSELARLLSTTDLTLITNALNEFEILNNTAFFAPCIENVELNPNDTFLADAPINLLRSGNYSHIPYIAGYTDAEGTLRAEEAAFGQWLEKMQENFTRFLPVDLNLGLNQTAVERTIREYYFQQNTINIDTITDFLAYHGDTMILVSVIRGARERALTSQREVRLYEFAYKGTKNSDWTFPTVPITGARHGSVLNYLLNYDLRPEDEPVMRSLVGRYVQFFKTGVPMEVNGPEWLPVNSSATNYLIYVGGDLVSPIDVSFQAQRVNPHQMRMTLWDNIYFSFYKPPSPVSSAERVLGAMLIVMFGLFINLY